MDSKNNITVVGSVTTEPYASHKYNDTIIYAFDISINRNYSQINIYDIIRVYTNDSKKVTKGNRYQVLGRIINSRLDNKPNVAISAESITSANNLKDTNELTVSGQVVSMTDPKINNSDKLYQSIILRLSDNKTTLRLQAMNRTANYTVNKVKVGDKIEVTGSLQSDRILSVDDRYGNKVYYLVALVSYIDKLDDNEEEAVSEQA